MKTSIRLVLLTVTVCGTILQAEAATEKRAPDLSTGSTIEATCKFKTLGTAKFAINLASKKASIIGADDESIFDAADSNWMFLKSFTKHGQRKLKKISQFETGLDSEVVTGTIVMVGDNADDTDYQVNINYTPCSSIEVHPEGNRCTGPGLLITYSVFPDSMMDGAVVETTRDCKNVKISDKKL